MSGLSTPWSSMFILPMRNIVLSKSKPWNIRWWKCSRCFASCSKFGCRSRKYSPAATRKPAVPQAGSQMTSAGVDAVSSTMSPPLHRLLESIGLVLRQLVQVVESANKKQIGDLLDHLQWIRNAAGPEGGPNAIDLILDVTR